MNEKEAVEYYHSLQQFGINPGLERISALCEKLGNPQNELKFVHIAGTNGKGSTCTEIASVLTQAGYRTGLYTSPYVVDFRERIKLDGEMIAPEQLAQVTEIVRDKVNELNSQGIYPTEFEVITAAAFLYYRQSGCDIVVLETGLGGRFDATNIINSPLCVVLVSISLDHTKVLGESVSEIAYEKCGIIKDSCSVVTSASQQTQALSVIKETACNKNASLYITDEARMFSVLSADISGSLVEYKGQKIKIPFCGEHQLQNAALAIMASEILSENGFAISIQQIKDGIEKASIAARTEVLSKAPLVLLDGSHNEGSTAALAGVLEKYCKNRRLLAVMGMMADKDCSVALKNLLPFFTKVIAVTPSNPRAMKASDFSALVEQHGVPCDAVDNPCEGVKYAFSQLTDFDGLVICGSLYLSSDVREITLKIIGEKMKP
ncbi:MAG: bifunctional folylpolyglutamate synthase/dihydrofolate synthase [Clostridia bacterium]|nr:bifunctional folylpolyglutamate synthase/dihydrofolate synthase [Clostridia bacterium]